MAEREGFEPSVPLLTAHTISSRAPSASSDISPDKKGYNFNQFKYTESATTSGGEGEIRTPERITPSLVFETSAFSHSATSPFVFYLHLICSPKGGVLKAKHLKLQGVNFCDFGIRTRDPVFNRNRFSRAGPSATRQSLHFL